ncbi:MAG: substrate-binding domain-containing protein [Thiothrix sp.]|nr:substrate-binding domain-containing protein [Thiothrix sp.]
MKKLALSVATTLTLATGAVHAFDIVGSSTVYPFATVVAETVSKKGGVAPKIESTGTGGGMKLFCAGAGADTPSITDASRRIKQNELEGCQANGVTPVEIKVGYDGIAIANAKSGPDFNLTPQELFLALAKEVPADDGRLVANPYRNWKDINAELPDENIEVLGPPPTSGTRDAFVELVMDKGCEAFDSIKNAGPDEVKRICNTLREDGAFIEAGENDNLIVQKLEANPKALGIFGFSFLEQNSDKVKGASINGQAITFENIASGAYPVSRPLYIYVKKEHVGKVDGIEVFVNEFTSDTAWGDEGYLTDKGMIPMPADERQQFADDAKAMKGLSSL